MDDDQTDGLCYGCDKRHDVHSLRRYKGGWFCQSCYRRIRTTVPVWQTGVLVLLGLLAFVTVLYVVGLVVSLL